MKLKLEHLESGQRGMKAEIKDLGGKMERKLDKTDHGEVFEWFKGPIFLAGVSEPFHMVTLQDSVPVYDSVLHFFHVEFLVGFDVAVFSKYLGEQ